MTRHAYIVAVDKYSHFSETPFCHADATLLRDTLIQECDYDAINVELSLLEPGKGFKPSDLLRGLKDMVNRSSDGDTLLFFFAGHGHVHANEPLLIMPETDTNDVINTSVKLKSVSDVLRVKNRVNVRIFDACHSGFDVRNINSLMPNSADFARAIQVPSEGWLTFAACMAEQYSYPDASLGHGIFTHSLVNSILSFQSEEEIYPERLKFLTCAAVEKWSATNLKPQTPTFNAAISGNVGIARRRVLASDEASRLPSKIGENKNQPLSLMERLSRVRAFPRVGGEQHLKTLETMLSDLRLLIVSSESDFESFGNPIKTDEPAYTYFIPVPAKKHIVNLIHGQSYEVLHTAGKENVNKMGNMVLGIPSYEYELTEPHNWPKSVIISEVESDGYTPYGMSIFYLVPMRIHTLLISLTVVSDKAFSRNAYDGWPQVAQGTTVLKNDRDSYIASMKNHLEKHIGNWNARMTETCSEMLQYLEWEFARHADEKADNS